MVHISALPPLDYLQAVVAAASLGSFTAAAERLSITHGALSRRVAAVEHWAAVRSLRVTGVVSASLLRVSGWWPGLKRPSQL
ncbi:LysR family transcriptional regulator [Chelativorans sp. SCAU2101]|uniref:LysR family transcriptional regulator n=1 Tax=Chelativorans petroleitrophicus TaxID=2975484 RepID=A0A9X2XB86_9HYPH|nr:LysR family transcriptional regulator [Chelativorans petroleitrophicus]MCT8992203.1 LysR family transcriptional regulator [Chelativorans petroleitrophicus]